MPITFKTWAAMAALALTAGQAQACGKLLAPLSAATQPRRSMVAEDLVRLRDIGPSSLEDGHEGVFSLSPDGKALAFQIRQADPVTNSYCIGMFVMAAVPGARPRQVDAGGDVIPVSYSAWGFAVAQPPGIAATITPQWSPDGLWIAYLRRDEGRIQVWRARVDGSRSEQVTHLPFDVETFAWGADGRSFVVSGRPDLIATLGAIAAEGKGGFHFDDRFMPSVGPVPKIREPIARASFVVPVGGGDARIAQVEEAARLTSLRQPGQPLGVSFFTTDSAGNSSWTAPARTDDVSAPTILHMRTAAGDEKICAQDACTAIIDLWAVEEAGSFLYLRHGRGASSESIYQITTTDMAPRKLFETEDLLASCRLAADGLYCAQEGSLQPRRIVRIDLHTGISLAIFDPNPEWSRLNLGSVRRLHWSNAYGIETFGDLVLPPDHRAGQLHPLIVVGYNSRGFLRGGTGDDYPIQLLAARGYAVLSYQTPTDIGYVRGARTWAEMNRLARADWIDFRSTTSAINSGIDAATALGVVDSSKLGLTGMSYGSTTAQFALVNGRRFSAAVVSNCCEEGAITNSLIGPAMQKVLHEAGYPGVTEDGTAYWKPISFKLNAGAMTTPLLMQLPDAEYLGALESYTALREKGQPVDLFVFPNETHTKWQPAHRLASYERTLDWFNFWLNGVEDSDPAKRGQYLTWHRLRDKSSPSLDASPGS